MITIEINKYLTLAIAVGVLMLGQFLRKRIRFLETFCIPAPVVGGLVVAIISCILYVMGVVEFIYDDTFREICMVFFFTSVGFQANLAVLKEGGKDLIIFLVQVILLIVLQNVLAVGVSRVLGVNPLIGLCTGSVPMVGGHGTAGAFGPVIEDFGIQGATTIATAAATFGLIAGSLIGGPLGNSLIKKYDLLKTAKSADDVEIFDEDEEQHVRHFDNYAPAVFELCVTVGLGTLVSALLTKTGMTFPVYIGAMIVAAVIRNIGESTGKIKVYMGEINDLGGICLSLFLGIAMRYCHDYSQELAARGAGTSSGDPASGPACVYVSVREICDLPLYGKRLRRGRHHSRYLRLRYGRNTQRHGQYAGDL